MRVEERINERRERLNRRVGSEQVGTKAVTGDDAACVIISSGMILITIRPMRYTENAGAKTGTIASESFTDRQFIKRAKPRRADQQKNVRYRHEAQMP